MYPNCPEDYQEFTLKIWNIFSARDLNDNDFLGQLTSGNIHTFHQRFSEMLFAFHLVELNFEPTSEAEGPDLCIEHNGQKIWIEIITPELTIPANSTPQVAQNIEHYLNPGSGRGAAVDVPTEKIVLSWTGALKEKSEKLVGSKKYEGYIPKGIVAPDDCYVIAINSILLGHFGIQGISQWPVPVEALFAVGPLSVGYNRQTQEFIDKGPSYRNEIINHNQSPVSTNNFLNKKYANISAVLGFHAGLNATHHAYPMMTVHNPNALVSLPRNTLGSHEEYIAKDNGDEIEISRKLFRDTP